MDFEIKWTNRAYDDLEKIFEFIKRDSFYYACSVANEIIEKVKLLKNFPYMGRVVPEENNENIREIIVKNYRIIYEICIEKKIIFVLGILHGKMLYKNFYKEQ